MDDGWAGGGPDNGVAGWMTGWQKDWGKGRRMSGFGGNRLGTHCLRPSERGWRPGGRRRERRASAPEGSSGLRFAELCSRRENENALGARSTSTTRCQIYTHRRVRNEADLAACGDSGAL